MGRHLTLLPVLLLLFFLLLSGAWASDAIPDRNANAATRLISGCTIHVDVEGEDELSGDFAIDATGELRFTYDDGYGKHAEKWTVAVLNKTAEETRTAIVASLKPYIRIPEVTVTITRIPRLRIEISGQVAQEGRVELPLASRLSDALNACICKENADLATIHILRKPGPDPAKPEKTSHAQILLVNYEAFLRGETDLDPLLENEDKIVIGSRTGASAQKETQYMRVVGEVGREVALPISGNLTVADALNKAGGLLPTADTERVFLVRGADGRYLEISADEAMKGNPVHNLVLGPHDLLIVGKRDRSLIYSIGGEVKTPQTIAWKQGDHPTLLGVLERAGGITKNADTHKGLLRKNFLRDPNGARVLIFDLDLIRKNKQPDWDIDAGDDIFFPPKVHRPTFLQQLAPLLLHFLPI